MSGFNYSDDGFSLDTLRNMYQQLSQVVEENKKYKGQSLDSLTGKDLSRLILVCFSKTEEGCAIEIKKNNFFSRLVIWIQKLVGQNIEYQLNPENLEKVRQIFASVFLGTPTGDEGIQENRQMESLKISMNNLFRYVIEEAPDQGNHVKQYKYSDLTWGTSTSSPLASKIANVQQEIFDLPTRLVISHIEAIEGDKVAQFEWGNRYYQGNGVAIDSKKAVEFYLEAAQKQYAPAQYQLGICYENGVGVEKDMDTALNFYHQAADNGFALAQYYLAIHYAEKVPQDLDQSFKYCKKAAEGLLPEAQFLLASYYEQGVGVEKNVQEAFKNYKKAAEKGINQAQYQVGWCYLSGTGTSENMLQAVHYFQLAASKGVISAQYQLGCCYLHGRGVEKNLVRAVQYFTEVSNQGEPLGEYELGLCFFNGEGVEKNLEKAVELFQKAADQGLSEAQYELGLCFLNGEGVGKNVTKAVELFQKAVDQGHLEAQKKLQSISQRRNALFSGE